MSIVVTNVGLVCWQVHGINIHNGIKILLMGIKIVISVKHWYVVGVLYAKVKIVFDIYFIIWINTILNHIDTRVIIPAYEGFCVVCTPEWY